jgi:hypothetical protein
MVQNAVYQQHDHLELPQTNAWTTWTIMHKQQSILDKRITAIHKGVYIMRLVINENEQKSGPSNGRFKGIHKRQ